MKAFYFRLAWLGLFLAVVQSASAWTLIYDYGDYLSEGQTNYADFDVPGDGEIYSDLIVLDGYGINVNGDGSVTACGGGHLTITGDDESAYGSYELKVYYEGSTAICPRPVITSAGYVWVAAGEPFSFTITATNDPTSFTSGALPSGVSLNSSTGVLGGTAPTQTGTYTLLLWANNSYGGGMQWFDLNVGTPPVFTSDSSGVTLPSPGGSVTFTAAATGEPNDITYQWSKNGTDIAGATNSTLTITTAQSADAALYRVRASNIVGTSLWIRLHYLAIITADPVPLIAATSGGSATFSVSAAGPSAYQWKKNGVSIPLATNATFTIADVQPTDAAAYKVWVGAGPGGLDSASAGLTLITTQPESQMANSAGASVTFTAAVSGYPPATYQWRKNGISISGATNSSITLTSVQAADVGTYTVVVSNSAGSVTSVPATLTIDTPPTAPTGLSFIEKTDKAVSLLWNASSDNVGVVAYNIYRDGVLRGSTSDRSFADTGLSSSTAYVYTIKAVDTGGNLSAASNSFTVTTNASASADSDADGIPDVVESALGTSNSAATSDADGTATKQNIHRPTQ